MKSILIKTVILIFLFSSVIYAKNLDGFGVGVIVGEPTGISIKYKDFASGIAWSIENHFHFHLDYWFYSNTLKDPVKWYIGLGGKLQYFTNNKEKDTNGNIGIGLRVPIGLQFYIIKNLELFGEVVPGMAFIPGTDFDIDAGIGIRYYF